MEQLLIEHVGRGEWLDLAADEVVDEAVMRSWGESRTCRAGVIRDARDARLAALVLAGCRLEHPTEIPLDVSRLTCSLFALDRVRIIAHASDGAARLVGANIGGSLYCDGAALCNDSGPALAADGLEVGQTLFLRDGFTATGVGGLGAVRLTGANIGGTLDCTGAKVCNDSGPALHAGSLRVGQDMLLRGVFTGSGPSSAVCLTDAHIGGTLNCFGAELRNDSGEALNAVGLRVGQDLNLYIEFTATGAGYLGAVVNPGSLPVAAFQ